jgi:hypothetical protein
MGCALLTGINMISIKGGEMGKRLVLMIGVAMCLVSLISGCTIRLVPGKIPPLDPKTEGLAGPFDNITVTLINMQTDDSNFSVKDSKGRDSGWVLSRKLWTEKLAEALGAELTARQGKVVGGAPLTISLQVTEVVYTGGTGLMTVIPFRVTANLASNSGWTKTYGGSGDASAWVPAGVKEDSNWDRAANWTVRAVVLSIMSDPEFIDELRKRR